MTDTTAGNRPKSPMAFQSELEFFATSIAALAEGETDAKTVLQQVIERYDFDKERMLGEQAKKYGYQRFEDFEDDLICQIGRQMDELKSCRLTSAERGQRRLIDSL